MNELMTLKEVAEKLNEPVSRVRNAISYHQITHAKKVGNTRLFDEAQFWAIKNKMFNLRIVNPRNQD